MSFLQKVFGKKEAPISNYATFWQWFAKHESQFAQAVKSGQRIEEDFLDLLGPTLNEIKEGFFYLTGMADDNTVELIITADGNLKNTGVRLKDLMYKCYVGTNC